MKFKLKTNAVVKLRTGELFWVTDIREMKEHDKKAYGLSEAFIVTLKGKSWEWRGNEREIYYDRNCKHVFYKEYDIVEVIPFGKIKDMEDFERIKDMILIDNVHYAFYNGREVFIGLGEKISAKHMGRAFKDDDGDIYLIVQTQPNYYQLISVLAGNRWYDKNFFNKKISDIEEEHNLTYIGNRYKCKEV
ncbi:MAG: hypothetical protein ACOCQD_02295 [archaeon]